jgi:post-segregation antitoxin (ccd killing protein)
MPRVQVYLPDDLYDELKRRNLPASELLQVAVRAELERRQALDATGEYLAELAAEVGEPNRRQRVQAKRSCVASEIASSIQRCEACSSSTAAVSPDWPHERVAHSHS